MTTKQNELRAEQLNEHAELIAANLEKLTAEAGAIALRMDAQTSVLYALVEEIRALRLAIGGAAPNYHRPILEYTSDAWIHEIGAAIVESDGSGPAIVSAAGHLWKRRSSAGKFGAAIWFSRADGKTPEGETNYLRLITFKDQEPAEALDRSIAASLVKAMAEAPKDELAQHFDNDRLVYGDESELGDNAAEILAFKNYQKEHNGNAPTNAGELRKWYKKKNKK